MTTDNASANIPLVETASRIILTKYGIPVNSDAHVQCILHAINLSVQDTLHALDEAPDPDEEDLYNSDKHAPPHWDPEEDDDKLALDKEPELSDDDLKNAEATLMDDDDDVVAELSTKSPLQRVSLLFV